MSANNSVQQLTCSFCTKPFVRRNNRERHCSWECRFRDIFASIHPTEQGCLEWPLSLFQQTGYGQFNAGKNMIITAHKASWLVHYGETGGLQVLHRCDNRPCINPRHLFLGTQQDNVDDMWSKDRQQDYAWLREAKRLPNGRLIPKVRT